MRILIATVTAGGGHLAAAAALKEAWKSNYPDDPVEEVDVLNFASKLHRKLYAETYVKVVEHLPEIYGMVFKKTDRSEGAQKLSQFRRSFAARTHRGFLKYLVEYRPDILLCPHFLPLEILSHIPGRPSNPFTVCVVTDFEAHAFWLEPSVQLYCVATEETKASLVARGVEPKKIVPTGIPIGAKFGASMDRVAIRKRYGFRDDLPIVLVLSGGFGMGPVAEMVAAIDSAGVPMQMVAVCGRNEELRKQMAVRDYQHPARILGFVSNMHELMWAADLILTKPGGLTSSEAMALSKPLVIFNPIPGQEMANSDFLLERGAAVKVNRAADLAFKLKQLLEGNRLPAMARAARMVGRPEAAQTICRVARESFLRASLA